MNKAMFRARSMIESLLPVRGLQLVLVSGLVMPGLARLQRQRSLELEYSDIQGTITDKEVFNPRKCCWAAGWVLACLEGQQLVSVLGSVMPGLARL